MKKRNIYYDMLRIIAILAVITMHVIGNTINTFNLTGQPTKIYNIICQWMYFAVPLFVMISGALFLNPQKEITIKKLYKKYISRILLSLLIFGIGYSLLESFFNTRIINIAMFTTALQNILTGDLWAHLWYLYLILGLYMICPLLKTFIKNCTLKEYQYILVLLFIFTILLPDICIITKINLAFNILIVSPYIFFFMLGDYLSRYTLPHLFEKILYIIAIGAIILITVNEFKAIIPKNLITYTSTLTTSIIISLFLLFKKQKYQPKESFENKMKTISDCCFGIYLIHQFFINLIYKVFRINIIITHPYLCLPIYIIAIFGISFLTTYILRKVKIIKNYIL